MRRTAFLIALALPACGKGPADVPLAVPAAPSAEEEVVSRYLRDNAADPKSVAFDQWGPHESGDDLLAVCRRYGEQGPPLPTIEPPLVPGRPPVDFAALLPGARVVRVRYQTTLPISGTESRDELYVVKDAKVAASLPNPCGDQWLRGVESTLQRTGDGRRYTGQEFEAKPPSQEMPQIPAPVKLPGQ